MIGRDANASPPHLAARRALLREQLWAGLSTAPPPATPRLTRLVHLPRLPALLNLHLHASSVAVAALALLNTARTRQPYAVFSTIVAGRAALPFAPPSLRAHLPAAQGVDGPLAEAVVRMVAVDRGERVGRFLVRVQREQRAVEDGGGCHAPWEGVLAALGEEEARVAADAAGRQTFVWDVSLKMGRGLEEDYGALRLEARYIWPDW